jgi:site-specific recombinase XerD
MNCGLKRQSASPFVFASERGGPFTPSGFAKLLARAGDEAKIGFKVHPHMLRHACGYALANKGIDTRTLLAYLGHRSINSTTRYAALAPGRFKNIWGKGVAGAPAQLRAAHRALASDNRMADKRARN